MTALRYDKSRGPVIKRETLKVARLVSLDGIAPRDHVLRFEREVLTVRETEAAARTVTVRDQTINEGSTHNDFYGFLTSPRDVIEGARDYAENAEFGVGDKVRREVVLRVIDRRLLPTNRREEDQIRYGGTEYLVPPSDWLLDDDALPPFLAEIAKPFPTRSFDVQPNAVAPGNGEFREFIIWRSDLDAAANLELAEDAIAEAVKDVLPGDRPSWVAAGQGFPRPPSTES